MSTYTLMVVNGGHTSTYPLDTRLHAHVWSHGFVSERVPLSGLVASLLLRLGRRFNVTPKSAGPETLSLDAPPFRTAAYNYGGLMSETPASYTVSTIPRHGSIPEVDLIFQITSNRNQANTDSGFKFSARRDACLADNIEPTACRKSRRGMRTPCWLSLLWPWRESACGSFVPRATP